MSEQPNEPAPQADPAAPEGTSPPAGDQEPKTYDEKYVKGLRDEAAKYRTEARKAAADLDKARTSSLTDAERAVAEAKAAGRTEAATEFGKRLARTEFDALAGRRNADFDTASALEYVDLSRFVDDNGEPDTRAIRAAVERLVPEAQSGPPSFDGGTRTTPPAGADMNALLRQATGRT